MNDRNPLDKFKTNNYTGFREPAKPEICPSLPQAMANPLKIVDYISCHKLLLIFIFAVVALLLYSGVKAKATSEGGASGTKGGGQGPAKR